MKESVLDVLMYLFENYFEEDYEISADQDSLKYELKNAGFGDKQVNKAFDWLEGLTRRKDLIGLDALRGHTALRVFNTEEMKKLDTECRGFILFLEQIGVLDAPDREMVVDRLMALDSGDIDMQQLKWVVLMVLLNQPGKEAAYTWMEDNLMDGPAPGLH